MPTPEPRTLQGTGVPHGVPASSSDRTVHVSTRHTTFPLFPTHGGMVPFERPVWAVLYKDPSITTQPYSQRPGPCAGWLNYYHSPSSQGLVGRASQCISSSPTCPAFCIQDAHSSTKPVLHIGCCLRTSLKGQSVTLLCLLECWLVLSRQTPPWRVSLTDRNCPYTRICPHTTSRETYFFLVSPTSVVSLEIRGPAIQHCNALQIRAQAAHV